MASFLTLPFEIRLEIYKLIIDDRGSKDAEGRIACQPTYGRIAPCQNRLGFPISFPVSLLLVHRDVTAEVQDFVFSTYTLTMEVSEVDDFVRSDPDYADLDGCYYPKNWRRMGLYLASPAPSLTEEQRERYDRVQAEGLQACMTRNPMLHRLRSLRVDLGWRAWSVCSTVPTPPVEKAPGCRASWHTPMWHRMGEANWQTKFESHRHYTMARSAQRLPQLLELMTGLQRLELYVLNGPLTRVQHTRNRIDHAKKPQNDPIIRIVRLCKERSIKLKLVLDIGVVNNFLRGFRPPQLDTDFTPSSFICMKDFFDALKREMNAGANFDVVWQRSKLASWNVNQRWLYERIPPHTSQGWPEFIKNWLLTQDPVEELQAKAANEQTSSGRS